MPPRAGQYMEQHWLIRGLDFKMIWQKKSKLNFRRRWPCVIVTHKQCRQRLNGKADTTDVGLLSDCHWFFYSIYFFSSFLSFISSKIVLICPYQTFTGWMGGKKKKIDPFSSYHPALFSPTCEIWKLSAPGLQKEVLISVAVHSESKTLKEALWKW